MLEVAVRTLITSLVLIAAVGAGLLAQAGRRGDVLDVNSASEKQLLAVPALTPTLAKALLARRPFQTMTDVDAVLATALSTAQRAEIYRRLFLQVNLNTASDADILLIPGLNQRMLEAFKAPRPYRALTQFRREIGKLVDEQELARLERYVFVPIHLNTASDADILSIPGMGQRMLGEFKEYRPYRAMQQFRREIGKYVDEREVARLERYVTLD
jgi:DNA uptake protein ComE-like DNA-binding protein